MRHSIVLAAGLFVAGLFHASDAEAVDPRVAAALNVALSSEHSLSARRTAIHELAALGDPEAAAPLTLILQPVEGEESLVQDARDTLEKLEAAQVIAVRLWSRSPHERAVALQQLGLLGDRASANAVAARLRDPDATVREEAAAALGKIGDDRAVAPLGLAMSDERAEVRMAAAQSLGLIGGAVAKAQLEKAEGTEMDPFVLILIEDARRRAN